MLGGGKVIDVAVGDLFTLASFPVSAYIILTMFSVGPCSIAAGAFPWAAYAYCHKLDLE